MNIEKDVSDVLISGTTNLTTTNVSKQIQTAHCCPKKGMQVRAGIGNGGIIYVGGSNINGTVTSADCGFPLEAGDQLFIPCEDPRTVYAFNPTANDAIHWIII